MRHIVTFIISLILVSCVKDELKVYQVDITSNEGGRVEGLYLKSEVLEGQSITITAVPSNENYQNSYHPTGNNSVSNPPAVISRSDDVNDILKRLHGNEGTEGESSVNNDRIMSDTTVSEGGTRRRKKKQMMVIT